MQKGNDLLQDVLNGLAEKDKANAPVPPASDSTTNSEQQVVDNEPKEITLEKIFEELDKNNDSLLKYLSGKFGMDINSIDDLKTVETKEVVVEKEVALPDSVKKFWEYSRDTGRTSIEDFVKANKDWSKESKQSVVMEHIRQVDGYDGELLDDYYKLEYAPDETESSPTDIKRAQLRFEKRYRDAINYFEQQKSQYWKPSEETINQRKAADIEAEQKTIFADNMIRAIDGFTEVSIKDFKIPVEGHSQLKEKYQSVDGILRDYSKDGKFDHKKLAKELYVGQNFEALAQAYADKVLSDYVEAEMKKIQNSNSNTNRFNAPPSGRPIHEVIAHITG